MKNKKKVLKSILCCTAMCSAVTMAGAGLHAINNQSGEVYATGVDSMKIELTNPNFNSNTSSSYPYNPNGYTAVNYNSTNSDLDANVNAGVINLTHEDYSSRFSNAKRTSLDNYVLMIDSSKESDGNRVYHSVNYGFQSSSDISLDANSKYMLTADVFSLTTDRSANLYLMDGDEIFAEIKNIGSYNEWTTYTFFVSTNNLSSLSLKMRMILDGKGTVLFDNLSCFKLSENEYDSYKNMLSTNKYSEKDQVDNIVKTFKVNNTGKFENISNSSEKVEISNDVYEFNADALVTTVQNSDGKNTHAILIKNNEKTFTECSSDKYFLEFNKNTVYKVDVSVKTKDLDGSAYLKLLRTDIESDDKEYEDSNKTITISSNSYSSNESVTNDYKTYSFFINSHSRKTVSYQLVMALGSQDSKASGEMFISEVEVSKANYSDFSSATDKINLVDACSGNAIYLDNAEFDAFEISDYSQPMPAKPISWTAKTGSGIQHHGVVNTEDFSNLASLNMSNLRNPLQGEDENVLMMYNESGDILSYTSNSKSLSANTYHKFDISVQSQNAPVKVSLVSTIDGNNVELVSKEINTYGNWEDVSLYIHTGKQSLDVSLKITLESDAYAYAYVDDARFDYILTASQLEQEFNAADEAATVAKVDLANVMYTDSIENYAKSTLINTPKQSGVQSGLITVNSKALDEVVYEDGSDALMTNIEKFNLSPASHVLGIMATEDVAYTAKTVVGYTLASGETYYKITIDVFTQNIGSNNSEADQDTVGATLKISGFDNAFTGIKSNNEWTTYTFYIKASSETIANIEMGLGNSEVLAKGSAFFGNITFDDSITKEQFETIKESDFIKVVKPEETETEDEETETEDNSSSSTSNTAWIYIIPSLFTVLAILIVVVSIALKKIKFKKPVKKTKTTYDRNKTVSVQYYTRKATTLREEQVRELKADLEKVNAERKQFEDEYKANLSKLRQLKVKKGSPAEITLLERELKKNQKSSSGLGMVANRISSELEYAQTDAYLNALIKKLMKEPVKQDSTESEDSEK